MAYLLNIVYLAIILLLSPWLLYSAVRKGKYREGWRQKLLGRAPRRVGDRPCIWLHAVSVGEVNLLAPLVTRIERRWPEWEIVISTTTKTGFDLASKKYAPRTVFYCPLDFTWSVGAALDRIRPGLLVLAELELWPNLIDAAHRRGVKIAVVNGRLGEKSRRGYGRIRPLAARLLQRLDLIAAQSEESARRFRELGAPPEAVHVTGSLKFDGVRSNRDNPVTQRLATLAGIIGDDVVFLAGSTQDPEERLAIESHRRLSREWPQLRLILVPRHPHRFDETARMLDAAGSLWQRRSRLEIEGADPAARILLVDAVGELGAWWGTAHIGFVGGSLGARGGQNMIEPAAYGAAICFGPRTHNFREIVRMMLAADAAEVVRDGKAMTNFVRRCLEQPDYATRLGQNAAELVLRQQGAADRTIELLATLMQREASESRRAA
ncbi:MAG: 3-deoxy-D-manno-octulosonic acid transferase [Planctomycetes bacterium]|nr:3-deoxy-D-manno-octulosonic acid transferase [Planctomycetota bacterium]